jgi:hypothetical protein
MLYGEEQPLATTRFPVDSLRFSKEPDLWIGTSFENSRIGFKHTFRVWRFFAFAKKYKRLDILINNAAQTVRRPAGFYTHLMENEERSIASCHNRHRNYYWIIRIVWMIESVDHWFSSNENMPVTWHGPEPGIGLRASAKLSQILFV